MNITIKVDDTLAEWARVYAARHRTSVSRMLSEFLADLKTREEGYATAMEDFLSTPPTNISAGNAYPAREDVHDRT